MEDNLLRKLLRQRLLATGKSQNQIASATGISQSTVGRFLNGTTDITLSNYARLDEFCDSCQTNRTMPNLPILPTSTSFGA